MNFLRTGVYWLGVGLCLGAISFGPCRAQTAGYDPYAPQQNPSQQNGPVTGSGSPTGTTAGVQQPNGAAGDATGVQQSDTASGGFAPTVLPNYGAQNSMSQPIPRPETQGSTTPLYARPTAVPGQFELFQRPPPALNEFESYVKEWTGEALPRFGSSLILNHTAGFGAPPTTTVPPDYRLNPGDELLIDVTGSVEAHLRLVVDSEGRIFIPRVGAVVVGGLRYGDLADALTRRFSEQFRQAKVSVVVGRLHGLTIYVTGFAVSPGAYTVSSLDTAVDAVLAAGGPSAGGSFRSVELRRNSRLVTTLDLYELLINGDKTHDTVLQNNDVLNIEPVGPEMAVTGSVNNPAIFEAKPGETLGDMIKFAGGLDSLADQSRIIIARLEDLDAAGTQQIPYAQAQGLPAERAEIVRVLSLAQIARPLERQAILATIEGEVDHPGRYYLAPNATMADLLARAGGLTTGAFVYGTEIQRETIRQQQQASFDKAINNLELAAAAAPISQLGGGADKAAGAVARGQAALAIVNRLRERKPDGRLVLPIAPTATELPGALALENNDRVFVPPRPKTVGVFGAVYQAGSFEYSPGSRVGDFVRLAGGPQKIADRRDIFVVRANGSVLSSQQVHDLAKRPALPGDVIFVPVRTSPSAFDKLVEIATVVFQFGIGALTVKALTD